MSFFGFEQHDLEQERLRFQQGLEEGDDVAVYTWGEESYDGLGDQLQEGGDDLNDETFGSALPVGKDFDFANQPLPEGGLPAKIAPQPAQKPEIRYDAGPTATQASERQHEQPQPRTNPRSLESIWDNRSPFSVLPRTASNSNLARTGSADLRRASPAGARYTPVNDPSHLAHQGHASRTNGHGHSGVRTLQEIEAEMLAQRGADLRRQQQQELRERQQEEEALRLLQQQELELRRQQILQYQEQQHQLQIQRALMQQQQQHQGQGTPPPRMLPGASQSPRFLEHQRQILYLQQQQELQQQQQLHELQEQLRYEEMERAMARANLQRHDTHSPNQFAPPRQPSGPSAAELQAAHLLQQQQRRRQRSQSPAIHQNQQIPGVLQDALYGQNTQMQQRFLSDISPAELMRELHGASQAEQEALRHEAMRKIVEAEKMEEKRRRKAAKIAHMARYNDLMTQSDKDFITRIQVSQLVTQDPYADDFYAQVYGAILRSRMGAQNPDERVLKFSSGGGIGLGLGQKSGNRRPNAMLRMEQQVERIVSNARKREEEKGLHSLQSLQGVLGKTSGRSYKAAPRQLLQVDSGPGGSPALSPAHAHISKADVEPTNAGDAAEAAAKLGRAALGNAGDTDNLIRKEPLTQREILVAVEHLYDLVLNTESIKRNEPNPEDEEEDIEAWKQEYDASVDLLWDGLKVMVPLETSNPHPFISLLQPSKGKKILPRVTRHLSHQRMFTLLTLLVACFDQLDVVREAYLLDTIVETPARAETERQTEAFLSGVLHSILPVVARADLRLVTGLLGLLLDRCDIVEVARSPPGIALLTLFLSRVEVMKQALKSGVELEETPTPEEAQQWQLMFDHMFQLLAPHLPSLFPSTRMMANVPPGQPKPTADHADQPVWQLLAAIALHAVMEQHQVLITTLREKILDLVLTVNKGWVSSEEERQTKLANVNIFLHALGLDSAQISL